MQACSFKIDAGLRPEQLPYVGKASAKQILNILSTGTCEQLEQMRCAPAHPPEALQQRCYGCWSCLALSLAQLSAV